MEVQEVVMEVQEESLVHKRLKPKTITKSQKYKEHE